MCDFHRGLRKYLEFNLDLIMVSSDVRRDFKKGLPWVGAIVARYYFRNSLPQSFFDRVNVLISFPNLYFKAAFLWPGTIYLLQSIILNFIHWIYAAAAAAAAAKSLQSCPTLCDPIDGSPPGSPVPGILQAKTLEWVTISSSNAWKWKVKVKSVSHVWLLATPWTAAHQAPPSMGFSRQEHWSGCHCLLRLNL